MPAHTSPPVRSLVGADFEEVRKVYGAPLGARAGAGVVAFAYRDASGELVADAVVVADGVVVHVAEGLVPSDAREALDLVGARVEDVTGRFGDMRGPGDRAGELRLGRSVVTVHEGLVVAVREDVPLTAAR